MKTAVLSASLALLSVGLVAFAQSIQVPGQGTPTHVKKGPQPVQTAAIAARPLAPVINLSTNLPAAAEVLAALQRKGKLESKAPLKPGVYKTAPYACLVLVPGPHPDDKSIITPALPDPPMLKVEPGLEFIPRSPAPSK